MRLLQAELVKLNRPLTWAVFAASTLFALLLAIGGSHNAGHDLHVSTRVPTCAEIAKMAPGASCAQAQAGARAHAARWHAQLIRSARQVARQLTVPGAGDEAAGLLASIPGMLAMALLAGGHVGGEWSGRTLKQVLTQCGRRRMFLVAKIVSLWVAGVGLTVSCWAALAIAGPFLTHLNHLPAPTESGAATASWAAALFARSLLVIGFFAAIGVLAAVLTRTTIGTTGMSAGVGLMMLIAALLPGLGSWTPATWIQGWMGFARGTASASALPNNYWSRFLPSHGAPPGQLASLIGLVGALAVSAALAAWLFHRSDVTG